FDAICFALYGETSGHYRKTSNLKSGYASDSDESFVEFKFSHQGKIYSVRRYPKSPRTKKNGEITYTPERAEFHYPEGHSVEGPKKVDDIIINLLNLDINQFRQVAMIAQGEFRELLSAKTEVRTEILRNIFMTGGYKNIESKLFDKQKAAKSDIDSTESAMVLHFRDVRADEELRPELENVQSLERPETDAMLNLLDRIISDDESRLKGNNEKLKVSEEKQTETQKALTTAEADNESIKKLEFYMGEKKKLDEKKEEIDELKALVEKQKLANHTVKPHYDAWLTKRNDAGKTADEIKKKETEKESAKAELKKAEEIFTEAEKKKPELENLNRLIDKFSEEKESYLERENLKNTLRNLKLEEKALSEELTGYENDKQALDAEISSLKNTIDRFKDSPSKLVEAEAEYDKLNKLYSSIKDIANVKAPDFTKMKNRYKKAKEAYLNAVTEYDEADRQRKKAERILENSRAGILAQDLEEGMECPVCGSVHHPKLAVLDELITEEEVNRLRQTEEEKRTAKDNATSVAAEAKGKYNSALEQLKSDITNVLSDKYVGVKTEDKTLSELYNDLLSAKEKVQNLLSENDRQRKEFEGNRSILEKSEAALKTAENEKSKALADRKADIDSRTQANGKNLTETETKLENLGKLGFESLAEATKFHNQNLGRANQIEEEINSSVTGRAEAEKKLAALESVIKNLNQTLSSQREQTEKLEEALENSISENGFAGREELTHYFADIRTIEENDRLTNDYKSKVSTNEKLLEEARKNAEGKVPVDISELQERNEAQLQELETLRKLVNGIDARINTNKGKKLAINKLIPELEKARKEYGITSRLYNLVKGKTGKGIITLEQFVQASRFDGIVAAANKRLIPMSEGQFELYRQQGSIGKQSGTFLDLEVLDNYTGKRHPVGNLSGGESFKASLSLALGLSDTVSSHKGGIQIDALFVDEGFGTLDRDSIQKAMDVLLQLSGSNKLVGIISHREELMEEISQQIKVNKTKNNRGSHIDPITEV
ncbi:MAG: SbcC/MukB-like Walker B domain-containing protein, partial [Clostridia bacterium]|nr:SbcC/MukB-like Walker B domain-containing protein [Clostridia bacterium]